MIPLTTVDTQPPARWQIELQQAITRPADLLALLGLDAAALPLPLASPAFPLRVPRAFVARMRKGDPADPLLRQVLPLADEDMPAPGFGSDPVGDLASAARPGLLHKYHGRVLLVATGACAVHCRYCFRRHFPYGDENPRHDAWREALDYMAADRSISEVILSGGDPLSLSDRRLGELAGAIAAIPHVRRLRIHTRQPVVLPARIDSAFLDWFEPLPLQKVVVVHVNHANEVDAAVGAAVAALRAAGATLFNQSVLLRGVNDSVPALAALGEALFAAGVIPYYLHLLDRVTGAAHFEVPEARALALHQGLQAQLPGYLVPRLVREQADAPSKLPVTPHNN